MIKGMVIGIFAWSMFAVLVNVFSPRDKIALTIVSGPVFWCLIPVRALSRISYSAWVNYYYRMIMVKDGILYAVKLKDEAVAILNHKLLLADWDYWHEIEGWNVKDVKVEKHNDYISLRYVKPKIWKKYPEIP